MENSKNSNLQVVSTPYDDVFRTLLNDCSELILPVINEAFGEHYTGREKIVFHPNEHFLDQQDGNADKKITDSSFTVIGEKEKQYLYECQSTSDSSMLVRIFEYATQIAIEQKELIKHKLKVRIPHCAVLFLRSTRNTPDKMEIEIETSGGRVNFDVPVTKVQRYSLVQIFEKKLLFLIPFYIFTHEKKFVIYDEDEEKLRELKEEYIKIMNYLDKLSADGEITAYIRKTIIEMSNKVLENIAQKHDKVKKGVLDVMGGKILEYEAKTILNEGKNEGRKEGRMEEKKDTVLNLYRMGMQEDFIAKAVNISVELVRQWIGLVNG